jgi:hypothetical protein
VRLRPQDLATPEAFRPYYDAFAAGTMEALDKSGVVLNRPSYVSVWADAGGACAELRHVLPGAGDLFEAALPQRRAFFRKA